MRSFVGETMKIERKKKCNLTRSADPPYPLPPHNVLRNFVKDLHQIILLKETISIWFGICYHITNNGGIEGGGVQYPHPTSELQ